MSRFLFRADQLALDFLNTEYVPDGREVDTLKTLSDLVAWYREAGDMPATTLRNSLGTLPRSRTVGVLEAALAFRFKLRAAVSEIILSGKVPANFKDDINQVLVRSPGFQELKHGTDGWFREFRSDEDSLSSLLAVVANSAAELLSEGDLGLVKRCYGDGCMLFFYDKTRNKSRRWCSMKTCGNRAKVAAHYKRSAPAS